jgi:hypothetical protein
LIVLLVVVALSVGAGFAWAAANGSSSPSSKPAAHPQKYMGAKSSTRDHSGCPNMRSDTASTANTARDL